MTLKKTRCSCRYPSCDKKFQYTNLRGRHESIVHGKVWNGQANYPDQPIATLHLPNSFPEPVGPADTATMHIRQALDQLREREAKLIVELASMERLRQEAEDIGRQKAILQDALAKLQIRPVPAPKPELASYLAGEPT